ncbi:MAG: ABC transporter ATP-binding protein [bacterium]|nr:ABC transporter ATP-binding protein [bacterium]
MEKIIETFGLTKVYRNGVVGVKDLSLQVDKGEIYGFLGSNGAGKTTTIRMLVNLLFPTGGKAEIFGKDTVKHHLEICKEIGYIPGAVPPHKYMTGEEFLDYMGKLCANVDTGYRSSLLEKFAFSQRDLKRKVKEYSTGMARKIGLIQAFQHRPRLIVLDEPTEGLDPVMQHIFYQLLKEYREQGGTVFISSHHLLEVEQVCDRAGIIRNGQLVAVEKISDLLNHTARTVHVTFKHPPGRPMPHCTAWKIIETGKQSLTATVTGDIDEVIKLLANFQVRDISIPNPSLQDVFLAYYTEESS